MRRTILTLACCALIISVTITLLVFACVHIVKAVMP